MFPMAHLCIAKNILNSAPYITNHSAFLLGSLAPDAVHFLPNFNSGMKKVSHLCVGDEKWGEITNNEEWAEHVLKYLEQQKHSENKDFILGYITHILADMKNNIKIWTPFRLTHLEELRSGLGSRLHKEQLEIDYELYCTHSERDEIWELLKRSEGIDLDEIIYQNEIEKLKENILNNQFANTEGIDLSAHSCITLQTIVDFIKEESVNISEKLLSVIA